LNNLKRNKMTAVEWLVDELEKANYIPKDSLIIDYVIKQSNKMFEQQIIEAGNSCAFKQHLHSERINKMSMDELEQYDLEPSYTFGEEYYNETFNK